MTFSFTAIHGYTEAAYRALLEDDFWGIAKITIKKGKMVADLDGAVTVAINKHIGPTQNFLTQFRQFLVRLRLAYTKEMRHEVQAANR